MAGYLRFATIGTATRRWSLSRSWPVYLAHRLGAGREVSACDLTAPGATAYDVRRVQLREVVRHRPHVVALSLGTADADRMDWDRDEVRRHLLHCSMVLSQHGAIVMTASLDPVQRGLNALRPSRRRRRTRIEWINSVCAEAAGRYGGIHLDGCSTARFDGAALAEELAAELARHRLTIHS